MARTAKFSAETIDALHPAAKNLLLTLEARSAPFKRTKQSVTVTEEAMVLIQEDPRLAKGYRLLVRRIAETENEIQAAALESKRSKPKKSGTGESARRQTGD